MSPVEKDHGAGWNLAVAMQLRAERAAAGMTVDQLAERAEIPARTLARLLQAQRAIDVAHLAALAEAFGLTLSELLNRAQVRMVENTATPVAPTPIAFGAGRRRDEMQAVDDDAAWDEEH